MKNPSRGMLNERARDVAWQAVYRARTVVRKLAEDPKNRRGRMPFAGNNEAVSPRG
jgi:hypothetical protein